MTKRKTKLPARYREASSNPAPSIRQSSRQPSAPTPCQRDGRGRYGSTLSPEPIKIPLNDTVNEPPAATNTPSLTDPHTPKTPARKRSATPTSRRKTTKKRNTPARHVDDNYLSTPPRKQARSTSRKRTKTIETEFEQGDVASDDSLDTTYLQQSSTDEGDSPRNFGRADSLLSTVSIGTAASISGVGAIQLDGDWFADEEPPPLHPGRARLLKDWELKQYIRRTDETLAKITKLLSDTQWLEDVNTTNREGVPNFGRLKMDSTGSVMAPEDLLSVVAPRTSSAPSTSENNYLSPLPPNIARTPSPTIASLRASGGGLLGKAPGTSTSAVRWVMKPRLTRSATATTPRIASRASSCAPSPLPSPSFRLKLDSQYHASIGTATAPDLPSRRSFYPDALRTGNDYSNPRGFPHTPPRVHLEFDFPVSTAMTAQPEPRSVRRRL